MGKEKDERICYVDGCEKEVHGRGLCSAHYRKLLRYDDPTAGRTYKSGIKRNRKRKANGQPAAAAQEPAMPTTRAERFKLMQQQQDYHFEPEPLKDMSGEGTYLYILNQTIIKRLYGEAFKAIHEPLYMAANNDLVETLLLLALKYAGYRETDPPVCRLMLAELRGYVERKDKINFMYMLANWEKRRDHYKKPIQPEQIVFSLV